MKTKVFLFILFLFLSPLLGQGQNNVPSKNSASGTIEPNTNNSANGSISNSVASGQIENNNNSISGNILNQNSLDGNIPNNSSANGSLPNGSSLEGRIPESSESGLNPILEDKKVVPQKPKFTEPVYVDVPKTVYRTVTTYVDVPKTQIPRETIKFTIPACGSKTIPVPYGWYFSGGETLSDGAVFSIFVPIKDEKMFFKKDERFGKTFVNMDFGKRNLNDIHEVTFIGGGFSDVDYEMYITAIGDWSY